MPEFMVSFMDQDGLVRSCHVADAKDEVEAVVTGRQQIKDALRRQLPTEFTSKLNLTMLHWECGEVTATGWMRHHGAKQQRH